MKKLVLIDAHAVIHRAFYALPPLTTPGGEPSQAVYGFTTILFRILKELKPDYIAAAFDLAAPTFRHIAYERYKAQRPETPSELSSQFSKIREVLTALHIPIFEKEGYEADDIIGTIAEKLAKNKNLEIIVVTGDLDMLQLVRPGLRVYAMKKGISETVLYDEREVKKRYGLKPSQLPDFKGLKGDPSDNIPGVKGIGEKTAAKLVKTFGSLDKMYEALKRGTQKIPEKIQEKLREGEEEAYFSKELATINSRVPLNFKLKKFLWRGELDSPDIRKVFQKFGFFSMIKRLNSSVPTARTNTVKSKSADKTLNQPSLLETFLRPKVSRIDLKEIRRLVRRKDKLGALVFKDRFFLLTESARVFIVEEEVLSSLEFQKIFESGQLYVYDLKNLIHFLKKRGIILPAAKFDLMLAAYVAGVFWRDFSYEALLGREFGEVPAHPEEGLTHFFEVAQSLEARLAEGRLREVFEKIEMPLPPILAEMENRGVLVDRKFLEELSVKAAKNIADLSAEIYRLAGEEFNINSARQLSRILFEKLGIKTAGLRKTEKEGAISTRESELVKLRSIHPIIDKILRYREFVKLKTTYIDALPKLINLESGRIHTTFNQTGTATGRLSSSNPNLQNIPIMSDFGREVRKAFVAAGGYKLVSFDYSQIELRLAAHIADDQKMIKAFRRGVDIHTLTAAEVNNIPLVKVTPELRRSAKTLNFGILYGMGANALAESSGMSREKARKYISEYFRDFSGIKKYVEETVRSAQELGYVETMFGRRRYIPEIHSPNWHLRREAERMAINMPIQGSATGDIIKMAMIKIYDWIKKSQLEEDVRLLLQVHDELVFEIKKDSVKNLALKIKELMENIVELKVPLIVEIKVGSNWGEQTSLKL